MLNYFNEGDILISDEMIASALGEMKCDSENIAQAKHIEIEKRLIKEEFKEISIVIQECQENYEKQIEALLTEEIQLLNNCSDVTEHERIIQEYEMQRKALKDKMTRDKETQLRLIKQQLEQKRKNQLKKSENITGRVSMRKENDETFSNNLDDIHEKIDVTFAKEKQLEISKEIEKITELHRNQKAQMKKTFKNQLETQIDDRKKAEFERELKESTEKIESDHKDLLQNVLNAFNSMRDADLISEFEMMKKASKAQEKGVGIKTNFIRGEKKDKKCCMITRFNHFFDFFFL